VRRLRPHIRYPAIGGDDVGNILVVLFQLHKVGDVEEGVAFEADIDEGRLHAGQDAGYATFVDGSGKGVFIFPLEVDFREEIVFHQSHFGFVRGGRNKQLFIHGHSGPVPTHSGSRTGFTGAKRGRKREDGALRCWPRGGDGWGRGGFSRTASAALAWVSSALGYALFAFGCRVCDRTL